MKCKECDGDGFIEIEVPRPHNVNRDIGVIDVQLEVCKKCQGDGEIEENDNE